MHACMQDSIHSWILFFVYLIACGQAAWITSLWSGDLRSGDLNNRDGGLQAGVAIFAILTVSTKHAPPYNIIVSIKHVHISSQSVIARVYYQEYATATHWR